jgi:hypothetical protein
MFGSTLKCQAGHFCTGKAANQTACKAGRYAAINGSISCIDCAPGRYAAFNASITCNDCGVDEFQGLAKATFCEKIKAGHYRFGPTTEVECPAGKAGIGGNATCQDCDIGAFQDASGNTTCRGCPNGYGNKVAGSTMCNAVPPGSYSWNGTIRTCEKGYFCEGEAANQTACIPGTYASDTGFVKCFQCAPGTFAASKKTVECEPCPKGWLQTEKGKEKCLKPKNGTISAGGAAFVVISEGWHSTNCSKDGVCQESKPCPKGTRGSDDRKSCIPCEAGKTSFKGSTSCIPCSKGKFASSTQTDACMDCPAGFFQSKDNAPSVTCEECPTGWDFFVENNTAVKGSAACRDLVSVLLLVLWALQTFDLLIFPSLFSFSEMEKGRGMHRGAIPQQHLHRPKRLDLHHLPFRWRLCRSHHIKHTQTFVWVVENS